jgi:hypothetical protein
MSVRGEDKRVHWEVKRFNPYYTYVCEDSTVNPLQGGGRVGGTQEI